MGDQARCRAGRSVRFFRSAVVLLLLASAASVLPAQKLEKGPAPVDVAPAPALALVGAEIELSGSSVALQNRRTVTLVVRNPKGKQLSLEAQLDDQGRFARKVRALEVGTYQVFATAPDGKGHAQTTFEVATPVVFGEQALAKGRALLETARQNLSRLATAAAKAPPSPPRDELVGRLHELETKLADAPQKLQGLTTVIQDVDTIVGQHPATAPEFQPLFDALGEIARRSDPLAADLVDRVRQIEVGITDCDRLDMTGEAIGFLGLALGLVGKPIQVAANLLADRTFSTRLSARDPGLAQNAEAKLAVDNAIKHSVAIAQGLDGWRSGIYTYVNDLVGFASQKVFGVYCEKFEGPFDATFRLVYYQGNDAWLAYDVGLEGMLFLRYEKGSSPTQVTGEFEGVGSFTNLRENFLVVESWARPYTIARWARNPALLGDVYLPEAGKLGRAALGALRANPSYFFVPVEGLLSGDTLALKFKSATQDYTDRVKGKVIYVLLEPSLPIPEIAKVEVKYQGAEYILSRATHEGRGTSGEPFPLKITVDAAHKVSRIEKTFDRHEQEPGSFDLSWKMHLLACNPACPY
jgi:hypothetical protein